MSNIYIQEPPTQGKVLLVTSVGDIDVELWSKEAPKACRNFVQLCMEGYYDGTIFHRLVKNFIVQGGDPTGTGTGGESIYGAPFKDEFHSRLRFMRRGLVAMANAGPHDNASQFFFTLDETPELQNKHTIFGKVVGNTLFNMLKLQEVEVDANERPTFPHKIIRTEILANPFEDIIPRVGMKKGKKDKEEDKKIKSKSKATKNFSLLSFGEEAEEDEEQTSKVSKKFSGKSKSSHDLTQDPRLSSVPVLDNSDVDKTSGKRKAQDEEVTSSVGISPEEVSKKLKREEPSTPLIKKEEPDTAVQKKEKDLTAEVEIDTKKSRSDEIKNEVKKLQKEIKESKKRTDARTKEAAAAAAADKNKKDDEIPATEIPNKTGTPDFLEDFRQERQKYKDLKKQQRKGTSREDMTFAILEKFQSKLSSVLKRTVDYSDSDPDDKNDTGNPEEEDVSDISWMRNSLHCDTEVKKKVLDANLPDVERYEINDPRNPLTQRRRESSKKKTKPK